MQLVVVRAVRKAVRAATNTFTSISMVDLFFIGSEDPPGPLNVHLCEKRTSSFQERLAG